MYKEPTTERMMLDLHMHLIPDVDDGAEDQMMARLMLLEAKSQGVCGVFCTPHSESIQDTEEIRVLFNRMNHKMGKLSSDVKLYLGCEVYCETAIMDKVLKNLRADQFPTMNKSEYVLTEFYVREKRDGAIACVDALVKAGYKPIIAHMERYRKMRGDEALVKELRDMGAMIQVNVYSLFEEEDDSIRNWARKLVMDKAADFLGSDAHNTYHRPPCVRQGLNWVYENVDRDYADALAWGNAAKYLCGWSDIEGRLHPDVE